MSRAGPCRSAGPPRRTGGRIAALLLLVIGLSLAAGPARALESIPVDPGQDRIEITGLGEIHGGRGDTLQVETASGPDGVSGRMSIRATTPGTSPSWIVFALHNPSDKAIERWLTAERYTVIGSSVIWPDLDARRIDAVTPSLGYLPDRVKSDRADIFRITLEPGQTITYVAELSSDRFPRIFLWKPLEYELKARDRQLFNGIMLGITGLLAIFLTAVFAANHKAIFPAASLVAWCVLGYLCVDFGFWHKLFQLRPEDNAVYRAATESAIAASIVIFAGVFLRLSSWHGFIRMLASVWIAGQLALIAIAVIDPRLAATFARASFLAIGSVGGLLTLYLAVRGQERALSLIPTWLLLLVWIFAAGMTLTGKLAGDVVVSGLVAGLVLIIVLMGFTVTQFAFRSFEPLYGAAPTELQLRSQAIDGAGAAVWEWFARRDEIKVSPLMEAALGLGAGELSSKVDDFAKHLHPADRERFRLSLWGLQERNGGSIHIELRLRHSDNSYRWFELEAASMPHSDRRALRCAGLMRDVTEAKRAQERLMHDAVHDSLTGLPNRELFLDRIGVAVLRAKLEPQLRPTVFFIDIDKFKNVNASLGLTVGDSLLLTVARRLMRPLGPQDTLARVGGDQFAMLLFARQDQRELALMAERVRRSLRSPIKIAGQEIVLTASTGIAVMDGSEAGAHDLLKEAEVAMYRAKRGGADRVEMFRPEMRKEPDEAATIESDLGRALERNQIRILYQPIIHLPTEELAGFEAMVRWDHPKLGTLGPADFMHDAKDIDLVAKLSSHMLVRSAQEAAKWQKELPRGDNPLFVSVNISSRQLFRQELIQEVRHVLGRALVPPGSLRLEITESTVMDNPELAVHGLEWLRSAGAGLVIDDFGVGYSSLAYLQRFPFDTIRIDHGLVQSSSGEGPGAAIVRSIVALAHELGKKVVAEGIEAAEDANFLRGLGCELAQGYYYGEPMSDREVLQLLRTIRKSERRLQRRVLFRKATSRKRPEREPAGSSGAVGNGAELPAPAAVSAAELKPNGRAEDAPPAIPVAAAEAATERPARNGAGRGMKAGQLHSRAGGKHTRTGKAEGPSATSPPALPPPQAPPAISVPPLPLQPSAPPPVRPRADAGGNGASSADHIPPPERTQPRARSQRPPALAPPQTQGAPARPKAPPAANGQHPGLPAVAHHGLPPAGSPPPAPPPSPGTPALPPRAVQASVPQAAQAPRQPPQPMRPGTPGAPAPRIPDAVSAAPTKPVAGPPPMAPAPRPSEGPGAQPANPAAPPVPRPGPQQYPSLPPAIAESLAKLAGVPIGELLSTTPVSTGSSGARVAEAGRPRGDAKGPQR
ncbi:MAG: EAL domain-containing protein [Hyphomicrobiaceae bacterium]|nr:EAL domain-containing protein [Hyphomicrobiaceae bacterium]